MSEDCWVAQYIEAVKQPTVAGMLDFIHDYPLSILSELAFQWLEKHLPDEEDRASLSESQQQQLEVIAASKALNFRLMFNLPLDSSFHAEALAYIEHAAPSTQAHHFMEKVLQRYLKGQQWDFAEDLAVRCQPWFPDEQPEDCGMFFNYYSEKQRWFNTAIPILERPAEGIGMKPIPGLNTFEGDEYSPVISADGRTLYFAGAGRPDNIKGEDVFVAHWEDGEWSSPVPVENLSGEANFVPLSLTADGRQMLVFVDGKLHISEKAAEGGWEQPKKIPGISEAFPWIGRAVFADNGRVLILSASREVEEIDRATDTDLFVAIRNPQGHWEAPFPISPLINTSGQERSPFLHADGRSLYFSSDGHDGLGKMDVYKTVRLDDTWKNWSPPINMGKEINTLEDEMGYNYAISASGTSTYLAMTDERNKRYDIYATGLPDFVKPKPQTVITLELEQEGEGVLPVIVKDADGKVVGRALPHPDGTVELVVPADAKGPLSVTTPSKAKAFVPLSVPVDSSAERIVIKQPVKVFPAGAPCREGYHLQSRGIFFEKSAHDLSPEAQAELQAIFSLLSNCPQPPAIEIAGFADPDGSEASNLTLSQNRAEAARQALVSLGYPAERITAKGYGIKTPAPNRPLTEAQKAECRKVEVRIAGQD
jgi:outer membrane protein OmpA-like peptidoglycan-associated protein